MIQNMQFCLFIQKKKKCHLYLYIKRFLCQSNMFYDSQSGKFMKKTEKDSVRLHHIYASQQILPFSSLLTSIEVNPQQFNASSDIVKNLKSQNNKLDILFSVKNKTEFQSILSDINIQSIVNGIVLHIDSIDKLDTSLISLIRDRKLLTQLYYHSNMSQVDFNTYNEVNNIGKLADLGIEHIIYCPTSDIEIDDDALQELIEECFVLDVDGSSIVERLGFCGNSRLSKHVLQLGITRLATTCESSENSITIEEGIDLIKECNKHVGF